MTRITAILLALCWGCTGQKTSAARPPVTPAGTSAAAPAPDSSGSADVQPPALSCGPDIAGAAPLLRPGVVILLGEFHGTNEIPAFVGDLACHAARAGHAVQVGVEIPSDQQTAIDRYLSSDRGDEARAQLVESKHWRRPAQDGRSSVAMVALLDRVAEMRSTGATVDVFAFDKNGDTRDWNVRDARMAENILARARANPRAIVLTLSGNLHNLTVKGLPWNADLVPMGVHVSAGHSDVVSLDVRYSGGTAWFCSTATKCGAGAVRGKPDHAARAIDVSETAPKKPGSDGIFSVGAVTAAQPAWTAPAP